MRKFSTKALTLGAVIATAAGAGVLLAGPASAGHEVTILTADLSGKNEVPQRTETNGRGTATVFGVDEDANRLCYVLQVSKIDPATAAHIHVGAAGVNGPVVVNLARPTDGDSAGCVQTDRAQEILANPANFYVNVHNKQFPGGAVRGQLG